MKAIYYDSGIPEKEAKTRYHFIEGIMMENAATALEKAVVTSSKTIDKPSVLILCGCGNNGGDGFALARRLFDIENYKISVYLASESKSDEAKKQFDIARCIGVRFITKSENLKLEEYNIFVDCLYGTGFHGIFDLEMQNLIQRVNLQKGIRIACDIPSGINKAGVVLTKSVQGEKVAFCAGKTVTMGALKVALFNDEAKDFVGDIEIAQLGISDVVFEKCAMPDAFLIEQKDVRLPIRIKKSVHKGNFGHVAVVVGEKGGAAVLCGTASLKFGAGFVTCVQLSAGSLNFLMSPELMINDVFPENTTAVILGSGLGRQNEKSFLQSIDFIAKMKNSSAVFDADFFYYKDIFDILKKLNNIENSRFILTPHPKELFVLAKACNLLCDNLVEKYAVNFVVENRFEIVQVFGKLFPNLVLVSKGANTIIVKNTQIFIFDKGTNALAKAGSGDVLAGLCGSLLAQNYDVLEAAKTAVYVHGTSSAAFAENFSLTPFNLIRKIEDL